MNTWPLALKPMISVDRPAPGIYVAHGPSLLPSWFLSALCPALQRGTRLFWIDAGNSFDAYGLSYTAKNLGWEPKSVLRQVRLARPFNLFQLDTMINRTLVKEWHHEPVVVSDPLPLFYDEDVPWVEVRRVFDSVLKGMNALPVVWMVLAGDRPAPKERAGLASELLRHSKGFAQLTPTALPTPHWRLERA